jgi:signal transduction histidine kinase
VVLAIALVRLAATVAFHLDTESLVLEFSTFALFLVPVIFAALNYGLMGALVTSGWVSLLALPRFFAAVGSHNPVGAWAELIQVILLDVLAFLVGQRVSAERDARQLAESAQIAHRKAEALYRDLFQTNLSPILIVDGNGTVVDGNTSAQRAFGTNAAPPGRASSGLNDGGRPRRLVDVIGPDAAGYVLSRLLSGQRGGAASEEGGPGAERVRPVAFEVDGHPILYRPTATMLDPSDGGERMQVVFEDVTAETQRHDLMEAFATRVVLGQEEERRHIAQELHDGPVQTLIHLCRLIDDVESVPESGEPSRLSDVRANVEGIITELRTIARGLRPSVLDDLGLVASIGQVLSEAGHRKGIDTGFRVIGTERRLPSPVELAVFRIAQEAITNAERHASARHVDVELCFETGGLQLLVTDDGVGFDPVDAAGGRSESLGLGGMTERALLIGSRLTVRSEPENGTTLELRVPATILDQK